MDHTQRQVASLEGEPRNADLLREEQVRELQSQLETLRAKMHRMETLERSFSETKRQLEVRVFLFVPSVQEYIEYTVYTLLKTIRGTVNRSITTVSSGILICSFRKHE